MKKVHFCSSPECTFVSGFKEKRKACPKCGSSLKIRHIQENESLLPPPPVKGEADIVAVTIKTMLQDPGVQDLVADTFSRAVKAINKKLGGS